jgi:hypothetical protein
MYQNFYVIYSIMVKIVLYTCNFGNYRNEFRNYYNVNPSFYDKNIDYFIFTDKILTQDEIDKLPNWNICNIDTLKDDYIMNGNRWTSKFVKFILPEKLKDYDVIVWVDSKRIAEINRVKSEKVIQVINKYPTSDVFNIGHKQRKTIQEELIKTIAIKLENKEPGENFLKYIGDDYKSNFLLPDTSIIIRRNTVLANEAFEYCFHLMKKYKLKRDQNIYNFAFDTKNITPVLIGL